MIEKTDKAQVNSYEDSAAAMKSKSCDQVLASEYGQLPLAELEEKIDNKYAGRDDVVPLVRPDQGSPSPPVEGTG